MKCPRCGSIFRDETTEYAPDVCSTCGEDEEYFPLDGAWRPAEPGMKRFFIADEDGSAWWVGVARDREHFIELLKQQGAEWEALAADSNLVEARYLSLDVHGALEHDLVEIRELTPDEVAQKQRCHTEDERGVIPLSEAAIGDLFCSEW